MLALATSAFAQSSIGIASGQPSGTNYPMVEDIIKACSSPQATIKNVVTNGALENIDLIYTSKLVQYGVVNEDTLVYEQGNDPDKMKKIVQIFPFFTSEAHLIVRSDSLIKTLQDLQGKNVVDGPDGSASWVTSQVIKSLTGLKWNGLKIGQAASIDALQKKQVDAVFITAGAPIGILKNTPGLRLVSIEHPNLDKFQYYTKARIPAASYPWMTGSITTYKVKTVLAVFAFKNQYQKEIGDLVGCIAKNVERMQTTAGFHEKWKDVDPLSIENVAWPAHPAAVSAIKRELSKQKGAK